MENVLKQLDVWFDKSMSARAKLLVTTHYIYSSDKSMNESLRLFKQLISFNNDEKYPDFVILDNSDGQDKTQLFYYTNDKNQIANIAKTNRVFIDNLKNNLLNKEDRISYASFFSKLDEIVDNKAFNFELIIILDDTLRDDELANLEKEYLYDNNVINYCSLQINDKKRLNIMLNDEEDAFINTEKQMKFSFDFKNPANADTGINNAIVYNENNSEKTILLTISAKSLIKCYEKYQNTIFEKNVRYSITSGKVSKSVDESIEKTIKESPEKFFIFNNGITLIAEKIEKLDTEFNKVIVNNFSIVNGAQTVTNLWKFSSKKELADNLDRVYVIAKLIELTNSNDKTLVDQITKSSNNQKPIYPRDLRSNSSEMISLKNYFRDKGVILSIKRGEKDSENKKNIVEKFKIDSRNIPVISNEPLAQYIYSTILMDPTFANQNKGKLFQDENYENVFKNENITNDDIYVSYKFATQVNKILDEINNSLNINLMKGIIPILPSTKFWIISLLWLIWNNKNDLSRITQYGDVTELSNSKSTFINNKIDDVLEINKTELEIFLTEICYEKLINIYNSTFNKKGVLHTYPAFSFKRDKFEQFLKDCLQPKVMSQAELKQAMLLKIFA